MLGHCSVSGAATVAPFRTGPRPPPGCRGGFAVRLVRKKFRLRAVAPTGTYKPNSPSSFKGAGAVGSPNSSDGGRELIPRMGSIIQDPAPPSVDVYAPRTGARPSLANCRVAVALSVTREAPRRPRPRQARCSARRAVRPVSSDCRAAGEGRVARLSGPIIGLEICHDCS